MELTPELVGLHDSLHKEASDLFLPFFAEAGGRHPSTPAEREAVMRACSRFERVIEIQPENWNALWTLGMARRSLSHHQLAVEAFSAAHALQKNNTDVGRELCAQHLLIGEPEEAASVAQELVTRHPGDAGLVANLGLAHFLAGRTHEALRVIEESYRLDPDDPLTGRLLAVVQLVASERIEEAIKLARHYNMAFPSPYNLNSPSLAWP